MDGTVNLKPLNTRPEEEVKAITSKGGKASGKARRKKKELKQLLELALSQPHQDGDDNYMAITVALIQKALGGDVRAYEAIRDTIGQKPTEQQQVDLSAKIEVDYGEG